jgi:hypothetical protein
MMSEEDFEAMGLKRPDPQEMKRTAIALLTLAVSARSMEDREEAVEQYATDFALVTQDLRNLEWVALVSMLANCGGALVGLAAKMQEIESAEMMEMMADLLNSDET